MLETSKIVGNFERELSKKQNTLEREEDEFLAKFCATSSKEVLPMIEANKISMLPDVVR